MCGIFFCVCNSSSLTTALASCQDLLARRGPDNLAISTSNTTMDHMVTACSAVLWLQGDSMTKGLNRLVRVISKNNEGGRE